MKSIFSIVLSFITLLQISCSCIEIKRTQAYDENQIKKISQAYVESFNKRDIDKFKSLWADNAVYIDYSTHNSTSGKDDIIEYFKNEYLTDDGPVMKLTIKNIKLKSNASAIMTGVSQYSQQAQVEDINSFRAEFIEENGNWLLKQVKEVDIQPPASNYEKLKELEWLVGTWSSEDEDSDFTCSYEWDKSKNFLMQKFSMKILDQHELSGQQIIGWDPRKERIRSWIFDSDGGFGESTWAHDGQSWFAITWYMLPDGGRSSCTHVFTKVDDNAYTFSSVNRDVDGKILPDSGPFKIIKKR